MPQLYLILIVSLIHLPLGFSKGFSKGQEICIRKTEECDDPPADSCGSKGNYDMTKILEELNPISNEPDARFRTARLIRSRGYKCTQYFTITDDGYNVSMWRIWWSPYNRRDRRFDDPSDVRTKPVVLMMHGLLGASHDFLLNPRRDNLPLMLSDEGYDVYLGNNRGTSYSMRHRRLRNTSTEYWKFSWHEFGYYDLPSMIDKILGNTDHKKIFYIGFSQGTTQFFVTMTTRTEYNDKVEFATLLAPVAYLNNSNNQLLKLMLSVTPLTNAVFSVFDGDLGVFNNKNNTAYACKNIIAGREFCAPVMLAIGGCNYCELNCSRIPVYLAHDPEHTAYRNLYHYGQLMQSGEFRQYDTRITPLQTPEPENYNWRNIKVNISLYSGKRDELTVPMDVNRTALQLRRSRVLYKHTWLDYEHLDFCWGLTSRKNLFEPIIKEMNVIRDQRYK